MNKKLLSLVFLLLFVALGAVFLSQNHDVFQSLDAFPPSLLIVVMIINIVTLFLNGIFLQLLTQPYGVRLQKSFWISATASFLNMITPFRGGAGFRAWYMKQKYGLRYQDFAISLFGNYVIVFLVSSIFGIVLTCIYLWRGEFLMLPIFLLFLGIGTACLLIVVGKSRFSEPKNRLTMGFNQVAAGWRKIADNHRLIVVLMLIALTNLLCEAFNISIVLVGLDVRISVLGALFITVFAIFAVFLNITPGSFGISEGFLMFSGMLVGVSPEIMLLAALIKRAASILVLAISGLIGKFILLRDLSLSSADS